MPNLDAATLSHFTESLFNAAGVPAADSKVVAANLVGANARGHDSHGVMRVPQYIEFLEKGEYQNGVELKVERQTPAVLVCDGQWGLGQVQAHRLLDLIIPKAKDLGLAAGAARHCGHIGRIGEYAERAAADGLVLIASVNNNGGGQRVAPPGGTEGRLGTNPLCVGIPTADGPVVLDFGTCVAAEGKVRVYYINGKKPVPDGWLIDHEGKPTNDSASLYEAPHGTILPMGGSQTYKGFGLALVLDMLTGGLTGGRSPYPGAPPAKGNNVLFLLLDPALFAGYDEMISEVTALAHYVRDTPLAPGVEAILLPGDPERITLAKRTAEGIPIEAAHWERLIALATKLGVKVPLV